MKKALALGVGSEIGIIFLFAVLSFLPRLAFDEGSSQFLYAHQELQHGVMLLESTVPSFLIGHFALRRGVIVATCFRLLTLVGWFWFYWAPDSSGLIYRPVTIYVVHLVLAALTAKYATSVASERRGASRMTALRTS